MNSPVLIAITNAEKEIGALVPYSGGSSKVYKMRFSMKGGVMKKDLATSREFRESYRSSIL